MTVIYSIAFTMSLIGFVILLKITPKQIYNDIARIFGRERSLSFRIKSAKGEKSPSKIYKYLAGVEQALELTGMASRFKALLILSAVLMVCASILCVSLQQFFLLPVLIVAIAAIPFIYANSSQETYKRNVSLELETALSIITTSYISYEDIVYAVESSLPYIHHPVSDVFKRFLGRTKLINSNIKMAIRQMQTEIDDDIFQEWCDDLVACQDNSDLKMTLQPVVMKYADERIVNAELEAEMASERHNFYIMEFLVVLNFPLIYLLNAEWFKALTDTIPGKLITGLVALICLLCTIRLKKLTRPVKYKR